MKRFIGKKIKDGVYFKENGNDEHWIYLITKERCYFGRGDLIIPIDRELAEITLGQPMSYTVYIGKF